MRILVIGSCTAPEIARCLTIMTGEQIDATLTFTSDNLDQTITEYDYIFSTPLLGTPLDEKFDSLKGKLVYYPRITYTALHPDCIYAHTNKSNLLQSPMGDYNSSIVLAGWIQGLTPSETEQLFRPEVFHALGFTSQEDDGTGSFTWSDAPNRISTEDLVVKWKKQKIFMHTINHPKLIVLADLARRLATKIGLATKLNNPEEFLFDSLLYNYVWPIYPGVADIFGVDGNYFFKLIGSNNGPHGGPLIISLADFIVQSYSMYSSVNPETVIAPRLNDERYLNIKSLLDLKPLPKRSRNPYLDFPDFQFWKRAVAAVEIPAIDPVVAPKIKISSAMRIGTAGSCFAQHISNYLKSTGYIFYVTETAPSSLTDTEAAERNYNVYSARYGNIYTSRQLLQLFDRAYGTFVPDESYWVRPNGRFSDPFRPEVEPNGFPSVAALVEDREQHFSRVRHLFETLDVFIFTLGLTETWASKSDGAVFPIAPGVVAGAFNPEIHIPINLSVEEVVSDLNVFLRRLKAINSRAKIILTVSPVPLAATFNNRHVLVSTTYSKSVLRVASEMLADGDQNVMYFPSYEIITGNFNRGAYYEGDLRTVTKQGVDHVMKLFIQHCTEGRRSKSSSEIEMLQRIICEEEKLDRNGV